MSEPIPAEISIGGKIPRRLVPNLCAAIVHQGVSLPSDEETFEPVTADDLIDGCRGNRWLSLYDPEASGGEFLELEEFLMEAGIAFRRKTAPCWQYNALVVEFRAGAKSGSYESNLEGEPVVALKELAAIAGAVDDATNTAEGQTALELLRRLRNLQEFVHERTPSVPPPLEPLEIVD